MSTGDAQLSVPTSSLPFLISEFTFSTFKMWGLFLSDYFVFRSVDGKVRCYDLRMGELRVDSINSSCSSFNISNILQFNRSYNFFGTEFPLKKKRKKFTNVMELVVFVFLPVYVCTVCVFPQVLSHVFVSVRIVIAL